MNIFTLKLTLEARKMGKYKNLNESDKGPNCDNDLGRAPSDLQLFWCVPALQGSASIKSGPRNELWCTGMI